MNQAQSLSLPPNKEILHVLPKEYIVDGEGGVKGSAWHARVKAGSQRL